MSDRQIAASHDRSFGRRIVNFPLVALVIAVLLFAFATASALYLGRFVSLGQPATALVHGAINLVLVVAVYKLLIARLGEQPRDDLSAERPLPDLGRGIVAGALLFSSVVGIAAILGVYSVVGRGGASDLLLPLMTMAIVPAFTEEILFRGILFRWIEEFAGSWAALVLTSALFGLAHILNANATWFSSFSIAVEAGLLLGGAYMLTRSLWMPIGLHAAWNFMQGGVFGVPVSGNATQGFLQAKLSGPELLSGGAFGLEASVIALAICTAAGIRFVGIALKRGELVQPWWIKRHSGAC